MQSYMNSCCASGGAPYRGGGFRRAYIVHGFPMSSERIGYHLAEAAYDRYGRVHKYETNRNAGPCGTLMPLTGAGP